MLLDECPVPSRTPLQHQLEAWRQRRDLRAWGHFWEQGTGKTFETIMQMGWLYHHSKINGGLVLAPNGVERNWATVELPEHWPTDLGQPNIVWLRSESIGTKWHTKQLENCITCPGMSVLCSSYDALLQEDRGSGKNKVLGARSWIKRFITSRKAMLVADESSRVKNPSAKRTILAMKAAAYAAYCRILNGTPVANSPFDVYSQVMVLDKDFWARHGVTSFQGFKTQFGVWGTGHCRRFNPRTQREEVMEFPELLGYRNLDTLQRWLAEITDRVLKEEVLDLPPKSYTKMVFDLSPVQRRAYNELRDECLATLDSGELVSGALAITRLLRLQQITCGYVPVVGGGDEPIRDLGDVNPRLVLLREIVEDIHHKAIIWTRFRRDADLVMAMLAKEGRKAVRYDGDVGTDDRKESVDRFQKGDAQFFVSNPAAGGTGLTLLGDQTADNLACRTVIYYSNSYNLDHRLQSEDRAHRIGQRWPVQYIDLVASDTIDSDIVDALKSKFDVAAQVTGDKLREWLT